MHGTGLPLTAMAIRVDEKAKAAAVTLDDGRRIEARAVVDATGTGVLTPKKRQRVRAAQTAWGVFVRGHDPGLAPGDALWMDWSPADDDAADGGPPSFLYALAGDDGTILFEETSLAARPAMSSAMLRARLWHRLQRRRTHVDEVLGTEEVWIPLDSQRPAPSLVAAVGAAAGLVHPMTGYSVAHALAAAPDIAQVLADGLESNKSARSIAADVDALLWSPAAIRRRSLQDLGMKTLLSLDAAGIDAFFHQVFALPLVQWRAFLDGDVDPQVLESSMLRFFRAATPSTRWHLARAVFGTGFVLSPAFASACASLITRLGSTSSWADNRRLP